MLEKLKPIENRYREINEELLTVGDDYQRAAELSMELSLIHISEPTRPY